MPDKKTRMSISLGWCPDCKAYEVGIAMGQFKTEDQARTFIEKIIGVLEQNLDVERLQQPDHPSTRAH